MPQECELLDTDWDEVHNDPDMEEEWQEKLQEFEWEFC